MNVAIACEPTVSIVNEANARLVWSLADDKTNSQVRKIGVKSPIFFNMLTVRYELLSVLPDEVLESTPAVSISTEVENNSESNRNGEWHEMPISDCVENSCGSNFYMVPRGELHDSLKLSFPPALKNSIRSVTVYLTNTTALHREISKEIPQAFSLQDISVPISTWYIPTDRSNRPGYSMSPTYITIHETDNTNYEAGAYNHAMYLAGSQDSLDRNVSWHFTVDDHEIYQHLPLNENGWHAGDGFSGTGNRQSIGIELCVNSDGDKSMTDTNAAELTAALLTELSLPIGNVKQHNNWSGKNCPSIIRGTPDGWGSFLAKVSYFQGNGATPPTVTTISVSSISPESAILRGRIESAGGAAITKRQFGWGINPTQHDAGLLADTISGSEFSAQLTGLDPQTTYYFSAWAENSAGWGNGQILSFTTSNDVPDPPSKAINPSPSNGASDRSVDTNLSWSNGGGAQSYDVYFGTDSTPDSSEYRTNQGSTAYDPGTLEFERDYYWRIDAKNDDGTTTGDVWQFRTEDAAVVCNYAISDTSESFSAPGGSGSFTISTDNTCSWDTTESLSWLTITSPTTRTGTGNVTYTVAANGNSAPRSGSIYVAGKTFLITQQGSVVTNVYHSADLDQNYRLSIQEIQRVVGFYNAGGYHCSDGQVDGYGFGSGAQDCAKHNSDFNPSNWVITLQELQRLIAFYNAGGYRSDVTQLDGFAPGLE